MKGKQNYGGNMNKGSKGSAAGHSSGAGKTMATAPSPTPNGTVTRKNVSKQPMANKGTTGGSMKS